MKGLFFQCIFLLLNSIIMSQTPTAAKNYGSRLDVNVSNSDSVGYHAFRYEVQFCSLDPMAESCS